jgi:CubicO group peptidase (beta-lactamase class C family)
MSVLSSNVSRRAVLGGTGSLAASVTCPPFALAQTPPGTLFNRRIPDEAHQVMGQMLSHGITAFAFTPSNGWVIVAADGGYFARGIPDECFNKLGELINAGHRINCIAFPPAGGNRWIIGTNTTIFARNIEDECYQKCSAFLDAGQQIVDVAFPPQGGNRWVVVANQAFFARNIDDECYQMMRNLTAGGRKVTRVAFNWTNGWAIIAEDEYFARRIDDECFAKIGQLAGSGYLLHTLAFAPQSNGWSITSRGKHGALAADKVRQFEHAFSAGGNTYDIWTRMRDYKVAGATVALVLNDQVAWACGYGFLESGQATAAKPENRFQAASVSKPVCALGVMKLVQDKDDLLLSTDIRQKINWTLEALPCLSVTNAPTLDRVLCHRGGIIGRGSTVPQNANSPCGPFKGDGGGFGGYGPGDMVPSLLGVMNGTGNSPKIVLTVNPGTQFHYSGEGFVLLMRMIEQVSGQAFGAYMQNAILSPLGMSNSEYVASASQAWVNAGQVASGHDTGGNVIPGKRRTYPELCAAGLYTTVEDLAKMVAFLNKGFKGTVPASSPLSVATVQKTLTLVPNEDPGWGRGFGLGNVGTNNFVYGHNGANAGFRSEFAGYPKLSAGYAVLVNSDADAFKNELIAALKATYGLP